VASTTAGAQPRDFSWMVTSITFDAHLQTGEGSSFDAALPFPHRRDKRAAIDWVGREANER
jgi:hypothetical protein